MKVIIMILCGTLLLSCKDKDAMSNKKDNKTIATYKLLVNNSSNQSINLKCLEESLACQSNLPILEKPNEYNLDNIKTNRLVILNIKEYRFDSIIYSIELFKANNLDTLRILNGGIFKHKNDCSQVSKTLCKLVNK